MPWAPEGRLHPGGRWTVPPANPPAGLPWRGPDPLGLFLHGSQAHRRPWAGGAGEARPPSLAWETPVTWTLSPEAPRAAGVLGAASSLFLRRLLSPRPRGPAWFLWGRSGRLCGRPSAGEPSSLQGRKGAGHKDARQLQQRGCVSAAEAFTRDPDPQFFSEGLHGLLAHAPPVVVTGVLLPGETLCARPESASSPGSRPGTLQRGGQVFSALRKQRTSPRVGGRLACAWTASQQTTPTPSAQAPTPAPALSAPPAFPWLIPGWLPSGL